MKVIKAALSCSILIYFILGAAAASFAKEYKDYRKTEGELIHEEAVLSAREGNYERALSLIKEAIDKTDRAPAVLADYAVILFWSGQYQEAIKVYENLPANYTPPDYVLPAIAKSYRISGNYPQAIALYRKYLNLKPDDKEAIQGLVYTYLDAGQLDDAESFINSEISQRQDQGRLA
jgi:Flp pilus assembly protein TadD